MGAEMMLKNCVEKLMKQQDIDAISCQSALDEMLGASANSLQTAAFLVLLRTKRETPEELAAIIASLKKKMVVVPTQHKVLDIVGTGGDRANTVNISTGGAILAASCGVKIAKHGNRAVSSLAGSADVLEALGVEINLTPEKISDCIDKIGIGFCFSPNFHPAMQRLRLLRKLLNVPTTFNILGPLLNPANPAHYILGIFDESLMPLIAESLRQTGVDRSIVVHGSGLDEISCVGTMRIIEITKNKIVESSIDPEKIGLSRCSIADLQGSDAKTNAQILLDAFSGKKGAVADTFILNAAVAMWLYGLYPTIRDALSHAKDNLYGGVALSLLKNWMEFSHD